MAIIGNLDLVLVEDIISHPVCKLHGWDRKALRKMIREGRIDGKYDSQGMYFVSEESLLRRNFGLQMDLIVKQHRLELTTNGATPLSNEEIAFCYLFSKILNIKIRSLDQVSLDLIKAALKNIEV